VKFSIRQILASTAGAVAAAVIASVFGVKGTIVGVAIGSAAATMATALVAQSIERGHEAVKQVAVRAPEASTLLRRLGGTRASGESASSVDASSAPTEVVGRSEPQGVTAPETVEMASTPAPAGETERLEISATADTPATQRLRATTTPTPTPTQVARRTTLPGFSWRAIAGTVAVVFVLALLFITAVELISGKPLSAIFGGADTGTTLKNIVNPSPAPTTTPTSTTSTTSTTGASSTTTTTTGATTTTSTTAPNGSVTTTTPATAPTTTTTTTGPGLSGSTTTTSVSSAP
jgi:hypothetical protein